MTYDQFKTEVLSALALRLPKETQFKIQPIVKNNDLLLDGLLIMSPSVNITPTLYLNYYFDKLKSGIPFSELIDTILEDYMSHKLSESIDTSFFCNYADVKDHVICKLISQNSNTSLLEDIPHIPFMDLAIVFCYYLSCDSLQQYASSSNATILIHHNHLKQWDIDSSKLYADAMKNTPLILPALLQPLNHLFHQLVPPEELMHVTPDSYDIPLYILSNEKHFLGANMLLFPEIISDFAEKMDSDVVVIPSSIHEVLLVPLSLCSSMEEMSALVQEVNETMVAQDERLSNHVYLYHRASHLLSCA